jgi:DNA polymerase-3 subunit delta'
MNARTVPAASRAVFGEAAGAVPGGEPAVAVPAAAGAVFGELVGQDVVVEQLRLAVAAAASPAVPAASLSDASSASGATFASSLPSASRTTLASGAASAAGVTSAPQPAGAALGMTHAWLFTGPPGSGRSVAARAFAAALLCADQGCGECPSCRQVAAGGHADLLLVRPDGLSYGVRQTRDLVLRAAAAPVYGRWRVVLFEDADRATEQAANALLKAIEEPAPRTVWLLCAPSADDLPTTIRSRCRLVTLRTPPMAAVAEVLVRDGIGREQALAAARAAQGHIGRARRLATDPEAARRRAEVLRVPLEVASARAGGSLGRALAAAAALVSAAEAEAAAVTEQLDVPEREALRRAFGEGSTGKGVATAVRGAAGALKELEDRQKSRATRLKRDSLDRALLDLAGFYRDVLAVQFGADVELANETQADELRQIAAASLPEMTVRKIEAIMKCRERLAASVAPLLAVEEMTLALAGR